MSNLKFFSKDTELIGYAIDGNICVVLIVKGTTIQLVEAYWFKMRKSIKISNITLENYNLLSDLKQVLVWGQGCEGYFPKLKYVCMFEDLKGPIYNKPSKEIEPILNTLIEDVVKDGFWPKRIAKRMADGIKSTYFKNQKFQ